MRIVHLADYAAPYAGGFAPMMGALHQALAERGLGLELVVPDVAAERPWVLRLREGGTTVHLMPRTPRKVPARMLRSMLRPDEPAILHGHYAGYDIPAVLAALGRPPITVIWHIHQRLGAGAAVRARNTLSFGLLGRRVAAVLGVAPDTVDDLRARGVPASRARFFPNGVDTTRFVPPTADERAAARARFGAEGDTAVLLHLSWDWQVKGGDMFVATVAELRRRGRDVLGVTVGGGDAARAAAAAAGVAGAVRVVEPVDDVRALHAGADVFLSTSGSEGMPFAVIEVLSSGVPAVASDVTAGHVAIGTNLGAYRLVGLDAHAFADGVGALLDRPADVAARDAAEVRGAMAERFDLRPWAQRVLALYEKLGVLEPASTRS